jgi:hypothetical protein
MSPEARMTHKDLERRPDDAGILLLSGRDDAARRLLDGVPNLDGDDPAWAKQLFERLRELSAAIRADRTTLELSEAERS